MGADIHGVFQRNNDGKWEDIPSLYEQDRHYVLFAWLGGVRNGYGFAGCETHTPLVPLSVGRGLPEDFKVDSDSHPIDNINIMDPSRQKWQGKDEPLEVWMGDHSHSWLSGDEIIQAVLPVIKIIGIVKRDVFNDWDGVSAPKSWCGGISGPDVIVGDPSLLTENTTHVKIEWNEPLEESLGYFVDEIKRLVEEFGEIRFVFGFDS